MTRHVCGTLLLTLSLALAAGASRAQTEITVGRFFGACEQADTNIDAATGEACIIQTIINAFSAADNGVTVTTLPADWGNYYTRVKALYAGGNPPDVHVMHRSALPEFAGVGALGALTADLHGAGIHPEDWMTTALEAVTFDGEIYGVPMDIHANLWHINLGIFEQAGLVDAAGRPMLPGSVEELLEHAAKVKQTTGLDYLAADFSEFPVGVRLVLSLVWQQGSDVFTGTEAAVDTLQVRRAVETIISLFEHGYANPRLDYADSQRAFLDGKVAVLVNGTWVVDWYDAQVMDADVPLKNYYVASFPTLFETPATWADAHIWVIPGTLKLRDPERYRAALRLLAWINDHNLAWARTGHLAVRLSVLNGSAYASLPHRGTYASTVNIAKSVPPTQHYGAIQDVLNREFQAIWLTGKPVGQALQDADREIQRLLNRN